MMGLCSPNRFNHTWTWILVEMKGVAEFWFKEAGEGPYGYPDGEYALLFLKTLGIVIKVL